MIIEIIGLPGSGKTFYFNKIKKINSNNLFVFENPELTKFHYLKIIVENIFNVLKLITYVALSKQKTFKDFQLVAKASILTYMRVKLLNKYLDNKKKIIIDQGIFQSIWMINFAGKNVIVKKIIDLLKDVCEYKLIFIKCDLKVVENRLIRREKLLKSL